MVAVVKTHVRMSVADFLLWESGDGILYELVDGEPRAMAPAGTIHGFLQARLAGVIGAHLERHRPSCSVLTNPGVIPRMMSAHNMRVPDLGVTCAPLFPGQAGLPDPVLLIEILSPSDSADTWSNVWAYTSVASVQDILIFDSARIWAALLSRGTDGLWPEQPMEQTTGDMSLNSIGLRLSLTELYARSGLSAG